MCHRQSSSIVQVATPVDQLQSLESQLERSNQIAEKYLTLSHTEKGFQYQQGYNSLELDRFMVRVAMMCTDRFMVKVSIMCTDRFR